MLSVCAGSDGCNHFPLEIEGKAMRLARVLHLMMGIGTSQAGVVAELGILKFKMISMQLSIVAIAAIDCLTMPTRS